MKDSPKNTPKTDTKDKKDKPKAPPRSRKKSPPREKPVESTNIKEEDGDEDRIVTERKPRGKSKRAVLSDSSEDEVSVFRILFDKQISHWVDCLDLSSFIFLKTIT